MNFVRSSDYYFTAVQWVNDGGVGGGSGNHEIDDDKSGASAAEVCVVWLNRAQNTSVTTLCKSPMWICQEVRELVLSHIFIYIYIILHTTRKVFIKEYNFCVR